MHYATSVSEVKKLVCVLSVLARPCSYSTVSIRTFYIQTFSVLIVYNCISLLFYSEIVNSSIWYQSPFLLRVIIVPTNSGFYSRPAARSISLSPQTEVIRFVPDGAISAVQESLVRVGITVPGSQYTVPLISWNIYALSGVSNTQFTCVYWYAIWKVSGGKL